MAMGKRTSEQAPMWIPTTELPVSPGHPFYVRLNAILDDAGFDRFRGAQCRGFHPAGEVRAIRRVVGLGLDAAAPDHSTISRTRRLIDVETHRAVFTWVQERLVAADLLTGRTVAIDATTVGAARAS